MSENSIEAPRYGPMPAPVLEFSTMLEAFRAAVAERGADVALAYFDQTFAYAELDAHSDNLASWLIDQGVGRGDRVMVILQNMPQFVFMVLAAWKLGAIPVPANPMYRAGELGRLLADSEPRAILCLDMHLTEVRKAMGLANLSAALVTASPRAFQTLNDRRVLPEPVEHGGVKVEDLILQARRPPPRLELDGTDLGLILYTSGTTGAPKGAMLKHSSLAYNAQVLHEWCALDADSRLLCMAPFFHITGFVCHIAAAFSARAAQVMNYRFEPSLMLEMIRLHRPTFAIGAITGFNALSALPDVEPEDMASFTRVYSGGAPIPPALLEQVEHKLGVKIHSCYGMTEVAAPTHLTPFNAQIPVDPASGALSVGVLQPGTLARIVDDEGHDLPAGQAGELLVKGPQVMVGYWRKPEESASTLQDGWMHTGDVAFVDDRGWFYLVDRKKDVIIASGFKVWPREVEDVIYAFEGVREAAVIGVPDEYRGETVKAFISAKAGATIDLDQLIAYCRAHLAAYKVPREVELLDELPKTVTGKIQRLGVRSRQGRHEPEESLHGRNAYPFNRPSG